MFRVLSTATKLVMFVVVLLALVAVSHQSSELQVSLETIPPGPVYRAASFIIFNCSSTGGMPPLQYRLKGYCSKTGWQHTHTWTTLLKLWTTTPEYCSDHFVCQITDSNGQSGTAEIFIRQLIGVGMQLSPVFGRYYLHKNNSIIIANVTQHFSKILCNSASKNPNIGSWITPSGTTLTSSDATYNVHRKGGIIFPSFISLQVRSDVALSSSQHGLYKCHIPDENGVEQTLRTWVFPSTYTALPKFVSSQFKVGYPLTLSCSFSGAPGFTSWYKLKFNDYKQMLPNNRVYRMTDTDKMIENGTTTTYQGTLEMNMNYTNGHYQCQFNSDRTDLQLGYIFYRRAFHHFLVVHVGASQTFHCSWNATRTSQTIVLRNGQEVASSTNSISLYLRPVNESIHASVMACIGIRNNGNRRYHNFTIVVTVQPSDISVSFSLSKENITAGESLIVDVIASKNHGLESKPTLLCSGPGGVDLHIHRNISQQFSSTGLRLHFTGIRTSDAGMYSCNATVITPLLPHPLVSEKSTAIKIKISDPSVKLTASSSNVFKDGEHVQLVCQAVLDTTYANTPVRGVFHWYHHGNQIIHPAHRIHISTNLLRSVITFTPILMEDNGNVQCVVSLEPVGESNHTSYVLPSKEVAASLSLEVEGSKESESVMFQLILMSLSEQCQDWVVKKNTSTVTTAVVSALNEKCTCHSFITQDHFYCSSSSSSSSSIFVTYRARLYRTVNYSASGLIQILNSWRTSEQQVIMFPATGETLVVNKNCQIIISSLNDTFCNVGEQKIVHDSPLWKIVASLSALVVVAITTGIATVCCCVYRRKCKRQNTMRRREFHRENIDTEAHNVTCQKQRIEATNPGVFSCDGNMAYAALKGLEEDPLYDYPRFEKMSENDYY